MNNTDRRNFLRHAATGTALAAVSMSLQNRLEAADDAARESEHVTGGQISHSACKWCYPDISLEDLCVAGKPFGLASVELLEPGELKILDKHGMSCAITKGPRVKAGDGKIVGYIEAGWNRLEYHDLLVEAYEKRITDACHAGAKNVICFSGNRDGMDDEVGMKNCAAGIKRLMPHCEKLGMTLSMELLNSKVNHLDYMCDHTEWGVGLCDLVGSDNFKLVYDIYHMQIMEGDIIATIGKRHKYISHYHTGGVPGRHEIDETQELNYPAIIRAIQETGYTGFVGQEFVPARADKIASLRQGVEICSV